MINGGLQIVNPSRDIFELIVNRLGESSLSDSYDFADQSLLSDLFKDRWVPLPYIYNALKTLRRKDVHSPIWRDDKVKNIHYILNKPWDEDLQNLTDETHGWWLRLNEERREKEKAEGVDDGF
jgi:lipopolysaccharide biosynthesis glycosyltransferase